MCRQHRLAAIPMVSLMVVFFVGCGGGDSGTDPDPGPGVTPVDQVVVTPSADTVVVGSSITLSAATLAASGASLTGRTVTWLSSNGGVAQVSNAGVVTDVAAGVVTITAQSEGKQGTAQVTIELPSFDPTGNVSLTGNQGFSSINIPAGVTVTVIGPLTLNSVGDITIAGVLTGECVAITVVGGGNVTITGTVSNGCSQGQVVLPDLEITGAGDLTLQDGMIEVAGNAFIRNDPALDDGDFPATASAPSGVVSRQLAQANQACIAQNFQFVPDPAQAPSGSDGKNGGDGEDGSTWKLYCAGNATLAGNVRVFGQNGGPGGVGTDTDDAFSSSSGGNGGTGGLLKLFAVGTWTFTGGGNEAIAGDGGSGGFSSATGLFNADLEPAAAGASALSGDGGMGGLVSILSNSSLTLDPGSLKIVPGNGGFASNAEAVGARGANASERTDKPAQKGGDAIATGGRGGDSQDKQLQSSGTIVGLENVVVEGGDGGDGGLAKATAGVGGEGDLETFKNGAPGGDIAIVVGAQSAVSPGRRVPSRAEARAPSRTAAVDFLVGVLGGDGGEAQTRNGQGDVVGMGGVGGGAYVTGGNGGGGFDGCVVDPTQPGGDGGDGGFISASDGFGGSGAGGVIAASDGVDVAGPVGNGGPGRDGWTTFGLGGFEGFDDVIEFGARRDTDPQFELGADGELCPPPMETVKTYLHQASVPNNNGVVTEGAYWLPLVDGEGFSMGQMLVSFFGELGHLFVGYPPPRFGFDETSSIVYEVGTAMLGEMPFDVQSAEFCFYGAASEQNPAIIDQWDEENNFLHRDLVTSFVAPPGPARVPEGGPNCFYPTLHPLAFRVQILKGGIGFFDQGGILGAFGPTFYGPYPVVTQVSGSSGEGGAEGGTR